MRLKTILLVLTIAVSGLLAQSGARYLIIANDTLADAIQPLAQWKTQKGMPARVTRLSELGGTLPMPVRIQNYIRDAYNNWAPRPEYILIVGATNGSCVVPPWTINTDDGYGDISGNYEVELPVGRFWAQTPTECSTMVAKTLSYEKTPPRTIWMRQGTTIVREDAPPDAYYQDDCRFIRALWDTFGGFVKRESLIAPPPAGNDSSRQIQDAINEGRGFVVHRGQCVGNWWTPFDQVSPNNLSNGDMLPVVVSGSCATVTLSSGTMLADQFVRAGTPQTRRGAVAYFGTANIGSHISQPRSIVTRGFFNAAFKEGRFRLGDACMRGKFYLDSLLPGNQTRYEEWTLLGDPELNLWTGPVVTLSVTCDSELLAGTDTFQIAVAKGAVPVCSALVCARDTTGAYQYGYTDVAGNLSLPFSSPKSGWLAVTVTAHNGIPWLDSVPIRTNDAGTAQITAPVGAVDSGTAVVPQSQIHNYGDHTVTAQITFRIDDGYNSTITGAIDPGADSTFSFAPWTPMICGNHVMLCSTQLAHDINPGNDTASALVTVGTRDVAARAILSPGDSVVPGPVTPCATLRNYGSLREPVTATFSINSSPAYFQTVSLPDGLPLAADTSISFPDWTAVAGDFTARCSTQLSGDELPANDTISRTFHVSGVDVAVESIIAPTAALDSSAVIQPRAAVRNLGGTNATFQVFFRIDSLGGNAYSSVITVTSLPSGSSTAAAFDTWVKPHQPGSYATRCSVCLAGDGNHANDALGGSFTITARAPVTGWERLADVPAGAKTKKVSNGGALACSAEGDTACVYAFKGNNRCEFYKYDPAANTWATKESIPRIGWSGKKKSVKKGAAMAAGPVSGADGVEPSPWVVKGNNTLEFWGYAPGGVPYAWTQYADVPSGAKTIKEGSGLARVEAADSGFVYLLKGSGTQEFYRYNISTNTWLPRASAPTGTSNKAFKNGSCLATDGLRTIWALKGSYNEFYSYDVATDVWTTKTPLPVVGSSGKKVKAKDGCGIACANRVVYCLKGGNSFEFWQYQADSDRWNQLPDMPSGDGKKVKGGGALAYSEANGLFYALKGNSTLEFYGFGPGTDRLLLTADRPSIQTNSDSPLTPGPSSLSIAPNPFAHATTIAYTLPKAGAYRLSLFDVTGKLVSTLSAGCRAAGVSSFVVRRPTLASGVYVLKLETGGWVTTRKLVIE